MYRQYYKHCRATNLKSKLEKCYDGLKVRLFVYYTLLKQVSETVIRHYYGKSQISTKCKMHFLPTLYGDKTKHCSLSR